MPGIRHVRNLADLGLLQSDEDLVAPIGFCGNCGGVVHPRLHFKLSSRSYSTRSASSLMLRAADYCRIPAAGYPSAFGHGGGGPQPDLRVALLALAFGKPEEMGIARRTTVERFGAQPILRIGVEGKRVSAYTARAQTTTMLRTMKCTGFTGG